MTTSLVPATLLGARSRRGLRYIPTVAFGTDLVLVTFSVFAAILGRQAVPFSPVVSDAQMSQTLNIAGPLMIIAWMATIVGLGGYRPQVFGAGLDEGKRVVYASLFTGAAVGIGCYLLRFPLSRGFFVLAFAVGIPTLLTGRFLLRRSVHRARKLGSLQHRVIIAGSEGHVDEIASVLRRETWLGYSVVGALTPEPGGRSMTHSGIPLLGSSRSIAEVAIDADADVVFLAGGAFDSSTEMRRLAWDLEHEDVQVVIAPSVTDLASERVSVRPVGGLPLIHFESARPEAAARRAKRTFDIVAALGLLLVFSPLLLVAALRVWRQDGGPILVRETRVGRDGTGFRAWSLRTMAIDRDPVERLRDEEDAVAGLFDAENDTRVTRAGRWMRRYSIDELPQLVNVLTGDMSLVGPRAPLGHEVPALLEVDSRLRVRPGLTGVWRDFRRSDLSWSEALTLDVYYAENWSMLQDLSTLVQTISAAAHGSTDVPR